MIKLKSLEFLGLLPRIQGNIKNTVYHLEISGLVLEIPYILEYVPPSNKRQTPRCFHL